MLRHLRVIRKQTFVRLFLFFEQQVRAIPKRRKPVDSEAVNAGTISSGRKQHRAGSSKGQGGKVQWRGRVLDELLALPLVPSILGPVSLLACGRAIDRNSASQRSRVSDDPQGTYFQQLTSRASFWIPRIDCDQVAPLLFDMRAMDWPSSVVKTPTVPIPHKTVFHRRSDNWNRCRKRGAHTCTSHRRAVSFHRGFLSRTPDIPNHVPAARSGSTWGLVVRDKGRISALGEM